MKDLDKLIRTRKKTLKKRQWNIPYEEERCIIQIIADLKHLKESQSKSSGEVKGWMCSKCMSVHTDKQPNKNISFVCDNCVDRI